MKLVQTPGLSFLVEMPVLGTPASPSSNNSTFDPCRCHVFFMMMTRMTKVVVKGVEEEG